jgi:phytoene desaturase
MQQAKKIAIIGSGFSSLAASCYLAKAGFDVTVYEKNATVGGRARQLKGNGFTFDIGPTWYWMPDVFEKFFTDFDKKPSDYYTLEKLSPAYKVFFGENNSIDIADNLNDIITTFESIEKGSGKKLEKFISDAHIPGGICNPILGLFNCTNLCVNPSSSKTSNEPLAATKN